MYDPVVVTNHSFLSPGFEESVEASQAVANCTQYMPQLKTLYTTLTDPLPVLGAMEHRKSPLEEITALISLWVSNKHNLHHFCQVMIDVNL